MVVAGCGRSNALLATSGTFGIGQETLESEGTEPETRRSRKDPAAKWVS